MNQEITELPDPPTLRIKFDSRDQLLDVLCRKVLGAEPVYSEDAVSGDPTGAFIDALKKGTLQQCVHGDWADVNNLESITVGYLVRADNFRIVNEQ